MGLLLGYRCPAGVETGAAVNVSPLGISMCFLRLQYKPVHYSLYCTALFKVCARVINAHCIVALFIENSINKKINVFGTGSLSFSLFY